MTVERSMAERSRLELPPFTQTDEDYSLTVVDQLGTIEVTAAATATISTILPPVAEVAGLFFAFHVDVADGKVWQLYSNQDDECNPNEDAGWMLFEWDNSLGGALLFGYVLMYTDGMRWWAVENYSTLEEQL